MPWHVVKDGEKFCVVKDSDGKKAGCHATKDEANAQLRALYANEKNMASDGNSNTDTRSPKIISMSAKELHDRWLEQKPEGASHDEASCVLCAEVKPNATGGAGDSMSDKTYTKEELDAAVAAAVSPLEAKVNDLLSEKTNEEIAAKIAEAVAEVETKLAEVQRELDVKTAEAESAKVELENARAYLEAEVAKAAEAEAVEARKAERTEAIKENANYSDEYIAANADRWAAMPDAEFAGLVEDLKSAGVKKGDEIPEKTGLNGGRETASKDEGKSALRSLLDMRAAGINPSRLS